MNATRPCTTCRHFNDVLGGTFCDAPQTWPAPTRAESLAGLTRGRILRTTNIAIQQRAVFGWWATLFDFCGPQGRWWEPGEQARLRPPSGGSGVRLAVVR